MRFTDSQDGKAVAMAMKPKHKSKKQKRREKKAADDAAFALDTSREEKRVNAQTDSIRSAFRAAEAKGDTVTMNRIRNRFKKKG